MRTLLLITFGRTHYGVWEDAVSSVIVALPLHRLPLSPPAIAGIALLEDRGAAIADLGACLGLPPLKSTQGGTFLIINDGDSIAGFSVDGEIERFACPPELVLSLPLVVASPVADTCIVRGASLIPIINIGSLHDRLKQGLLELPSPAPGPPARVIDLSAVRSVRMFSVGGARFCVDAEDSDFTVLGEAGIVPVPVRYNRLAGVALRNGAVVPVMLPGAFLGLGDQDDRKGMLFAGPRGSQYGLAIDEDLGVVEGHDLTVLALPVLAARPWFPAAVLAQDKICLLADIGLFAALTDTAGERPAPAVFSTASLFPTQFRTSDAEVVEFSLLGARHAVPKEEMRKVHPLLPFVPVPGTPEIIIGVAELNRELLPVLDLATVFGRRSPVGTKSRMMHIVNGDFQALVIADDVTGSRQLPVETQRQVPIDLPYQVLYGCYLETGVVRLILNVESLAVHFEKAAVRELVAGLSPDVDEQPEQTQEALEQVAPASPATEFVHQPSEVPLSDQDKDAVTVAYAAEPAPTAAGDIAQPGALEAERRREARIQAAAEAAARELARQRVEAEKLWAEDEARSGAAEQTRLKAEAEAQALEEKHLHEEAEKLKTEEAARARAEAEIKAQEQETARRKAAVDAEKRAAEETRKQEEEDTKRKSEEQASIAAEENFKREADEARHRQDEEAQRRAVAEAAEKSMMMTEPRSSPALKPGEGQPAARESGKHIGIASVVAILAALFLYFVSMPKRPEPLGPLDPARTEKEAATRKSVPQSEKEPPLFLTVPPNKAVPAPFVYTVVKGDNLWNIAKRFTGNPLNYPRVAKGNSIATPDLIFPGQRIQIRNEPAPGR